MTKIDYFSHDCHARFDPKLIRLRMDIGPVGDGIYWSLVEMMYEEGGYIFYKDLPNLAKLLNTTEEMLNKVVKESELFTQNGDKFYSVTLLERLKHINLKRRKATASANKRWHSNVVRSHSRRNALKESIVKESKDITPPVGFTLDDLGKPIRYLNEKTGSRFDHTNRNSLIMVSARLKDGFMLEDFQTIIDLKTKQWKNNPRMVGCLKPDTLFRPTHMESYLNEAKALGRIAKNAG